MTVETIGRLEAIFNKQRSHMEKYAEIEDHNGLLQTPAIPVDLNDRFGQARLKDFAWRISEELGEALDSLAKGEDAAYDEELSDVLHFLTELTILAGYTPQDIAGGDDTEEDLLFILFTEAVQIIPTGSKRNYQHLTLFTGIVLQELALTMNCLKNKPWKQSHRETDVELFRQRLISTWIAFIALCIVADIDSDKLYDLYFGKAAINDQRRATGY
jgi:dimeric dUTPase (all-alpha-NTP-PPase superfamily)